MRLANLSIRRKLMLIMLITSGIVLMLTSIAFFWYQWYTSRQSLILNVTTLSTVVADNSTAALAFQNPKDARQVLNALKAETTIHEAVLYDVQGNAFAVYPENSNIPTQKLMDLTGAGHQSTGGDRLVVYQPVIESKTRYGTLVIYADLGVIYDRLRNFANIVLLILLFSFLAALLLSAILQNSISYPVRSLAQAAQQVSQNQDYAVRVQKLGDDELGMLTQTFNEMLARIQESDAGLRKAIGEKDVLIQEVHHRVKNNLQVILSLFDLQSRYMTRENALEVFQDCKARIRSMSLVHEMLYGSSDLSKINYREYVRHLVADLTDAFHPVPDQLKVTIDLQKVELDINRAVPLGLLTSEVLTNSLKHAFRNDADPEILIRQMPGDGLAIQIGDNGCGLPADTDFDNPKSFGLKIIRLLAEQLNAELSVDSTKGTTYTIHMKN